MLNSKILDDISARLGEVIRNSPARDIEKNVRAMLGVMFNKLDLVTRDEFEVQAELLRRTRERLEALEARLGAAPAPGPAPAPVPGPDGK